MKKCNQTYDLKVGENLNYQSYLFIFIYLNKYNININKILLNNEYKIIKTNITIIKLRTIFFSFISFNPMQ